MAPYFGQCLCGSVRYRVSKEPLTLYACHCTECQRRTGSAFALSLIVRRDDLQLVSGQTTGYSASLADGRTKSGQMCPSCGTRLWGTPAKYPGIVIVQPGTLEQPCHLVPIAHQWLSEAQPWFVPPPGVPAYPRGPADPGEFVRLWQQRKNES
ncbi:MAG: GFA family protein [Burkholderiales bacterium]|nr:GFA family protein [Burkholderiales bacterium]